MCMCTIIMPAPQICFLLKQVTCTILNELISTNCCSMLVNMSWNKVTIEFQTNCIFRASNLAPSACCLNKIPQVVDEHRLSRHFCLYIEHSWTEKNVDGWSWFNPHKLLLTLCVLLRRTMLDSDGNINEGSGNVNGDRNNVANDITTGRPRSGGYASTSDTRYAVSWSENPLQQSSRGSTSNSC